MQRKLMFNVVDRKVLWCDKLLPLDAQGLSPLWVRTVWYIQFGPTAGLAPVITKFFFQKIVIYFMISENQLFDMKNSNVKYQEKFKIFLYQTSDISKNDILI